MSNDSVDTLCVADSATVKIPSKNFRFFGRTIFVQCDKNGWWITNSKGRKHIMHFSVVTMEHPCGWATNITVGRLHISIIKLKPLKDRQ